MRLPLAPLLPLTLTLYRLHADAVPRPTQLNFSDLPTEINDQIFGNTDLVAYVTALGTTRGAPLVTPEVEERLLCHAAEEVKHLRIYDDNQRARLSLILEATRAIIKQRSGLPKIIPSTIDIPALEKLAAQFEITFLKYASLSSSRTWAKFCMAALLGKDTLIRLLSSLSEGFFNKHKCSMLQAAAVVGDFDTLHAVATHYTISYFDLKFYINDDAFFSGNVEFVQKIVKFILGFIPDWPEWLSEAIKQNRRPLIAYLYRKTKKQVRYQGNLDNGLEKVFWELASRGWEDRFEKLYSKHSQHLDVKGCLRKAANHGRINILRYLLFHEGLGSEARSFLRSAFEAAVGSGNIDTIEFLLGYDERENPQISMLSFTQPNSNILRAAGKSGRWDGIEYLMERRNKEDARFADFKLAGDAERAMYAACRHGSLNVLKHLLQKDSQGHFVFTFNASEVLKCSLMYACELGNWSIVQELLKYSDVNPAADDNQALIAACETGHHLVVRELLRDGHVDAGARDNAPLIAACRGGHLLVIRELLQRDNNGNHLDNVDPAANDNEPLIAACDNGNLLVVRKLLQHERVDPSARCNQPLITACGKGHLLLVQEFLRDSRVDAGVQGGKPLIAACRGGHLLVVNQLLQKRDGKYVYSVDRVVDRNEALIAACETGHHLVVQKLLRDPQVDAGARDNAPLIAACRGGHLLVVRELLQKDDSGNHLDNVDPAANDNAPLIAACENGTLLVVRELLKHERVDPSARYNQPLITACGKGHSLVVQELLQKDDDGNHIYTGINPAARNNQCLIDACKYGHLKVVKCLLQRRLNAHGVVEYKHVGINVAAQDNLALLEAVTWHHPAIVKFLLQKTNKGDYIFSGIAITEQIRQKVAYTRNWELRKLLK